MVFDELLVDFLKDQSSLTSLINTRIYPSIMPKTSKFPALTYDIVSEYELTNAIQGNTGVINLHLQFTILAKTRSSVSSIKEVLKTILRNYQDYSDFGTYYLQLCTILPTLGTRFEDNIYTETLEFQFIYNEK